MDSNDGLKKERKKERKKLQQNIEAVLCTDLDTTRLR